MYSSSDTKLGTRQLKT